MVSSVLCRCVASPPPDAAAAASSSASSPASLDPCGGAVCGGPEHRLRLWSLFQTLDVNRDGGLCVNDLAVGLPRLGLHRTEGELRVGGAHYPRWQGEGPLAPRDLWEARVTALGRWLTGLNGPASWEVPQSVAGLVEGLLVWVATFSDR